ncbi:NAD(P)H-dependent glycerol-3-phosphate dehydrogenase [Leptolyngbya sp. AN02str]|uniref:NAD(P)H-dependent glycerol-3-phosphate dehydrogenase n=1 Tax=Leptolyngbya sp. AN02str TaxID=3423363 RepID=UPI003D30FA1D
MQTSTTDKPLTLTVLGAGAWGSVLTELVHRNSHRRQQNVHLWSRQHGTPLETLLTSSNIVVSAISMSGVAEVASRVAQHGLPANTILVSATKGLDLATTCTASQVWQTMFPRHPVVVLSGPNLAKEIQLGLPAATVVASKDEAAARLVQQAFASDRFRVYTNTDPLGTELGGTLKNVIAIAVGVCDGLQLGTNAKSALITRSLTEIIRVGTYLGGDTETFFGLSGLGDLLATCNSPLSRNYQVGFKLAEGKTLPQTLAEIGETAEGVNTANVLYALSQRESIPMPISYLVYLLLNGNITPQQAVEALMERDLKAEK